MTAEINGTTDLATGNGRPINALFVVPSLKRAGAESQLIDLVNKLDSTRFRKTLVVLEDNLDQLEKVDTQSVEVISIPKQGRLDMGQIKKIAELLDNRLIDVIHATLQYSVFIAWLARLWAKQSPHLVAAIHTTKNVGYKEELFDQLVYRPVLHRCDHIIFVCGHQMAYWISRFPEIAKKSTVIYNGVDPVAYRREDHVQRGKELLRTLGVQEGQFVIACIAGFRREKGHSILIESFCNLPENTRLILAGDGMMRAKMEQLATKLGVSDRIYFLGNLSDIRPLLSVTDVMVLASTAVETFSMAMLEAMSMKVPVVASDIGGLGEAISDGVTGYLVPAEDKEGLGAAINRLMAAGDVSAIRENCREVVLSRFTSNTMVMATNSCLQKVAY